MKDWIVPVGIGFAIFCITFAILYYALSVDNKAEIYPATLIVVEIHDDYVVGETSTGFRYKIEEEDYEIGDYVSCMMDNNNTPDTIEDDKVISHQFGGYRRME